MSPGVLAGQRQCVRRDVRCDDLCRWAFHRKRDGDAPAARAKVQSTQILVGRVLSRKAGRRGALGQRALPKSTRWPGHVASTHNVNLQMWHGFAAIRAIVDDEPVAPF